MKLVRIDSANLYVLIAAALLLILSEDVFAKAKPVAKKNDILFTRYLDSGGTEGFKVTCGLNAECLVELNKNGAPIKKRTLALEKIEKFSQQFVKNLEAAGEQPMRSKDDTQHILEWKAELGEKVVQGSIGQKQDVSNVSKTIDAVAILEAQLWLEINQ
jgi:hypothetical protein